MDGTQSTDRANQWRAKASGDEGALSLCILRQSQLRLRHWRTPSRRLSAGPPRNQLALQKSTVAVLVWWPCARLSPLTGGFQVGRRCQARSVPSSTKPRPRPTHTGAVRSPKVRWISAPHPLDLASHPSSMTGQTYQTDHRQLNNPRQITPTKQKGANNEHFFLLSPPAPASYDGFPPAYSKHPPFPCSSWPTSTPRLPGPFRGSQAAFEAGSKQTARLPALSRFPQRRLQGDCIPFLWSTALAGPVQAGPKGPTGEANPPLCRGNVSTKSVRRSQDVTWRQRHSRQAYRSWL